MAAITLQNIRKTFGPVEVVRDLSLEVEDGEFLTLLGPSGCGKSTLLRLIAGLDEPNAGSISFDGKTVTHTSPAQRNVAMVFQSYALYAHMTVRQNLLYPLRKRGVPKSEWPARLAAVAELLQIVPLLARRPAQLSGGQQQRVAVGRAMIREPAVFLFDEPLSNLDASLRAHMRSEIIRLHLRLGKTMVFVTHDQIEAMTMSSRIAVLDGGRLQQLGTPAEVYARPANRFVATFVGTPTMNFWPGTLEQRPDGWVFQGHRPAVTIPVVLPTGTLPTGMPTTAVVAGVRPQDLLLDPDGLPARVVLVESTGQETLVTAAAEGVEFVLRLDSECALRPGEAIAVAARPGRLHLFHATTGVRIGP